MKEEMLACDEVMDRLWDYLDGDLDPIMAGKIEAHLDVCGRCFPQYDFRRAFKELVRRSGEGPVPPGLRRRVFETLLEEDARGGGEEPPHGWWARLVGWLRPMRGG
jgi:anti-sigma factor (TIGR02949 family)